MSNHTHTGKAKGGALKVGFVLVALGVGGVAYWWFTNSGQPDAEQQTQEVLSQNTAPVEQNPATN
jgi:nitrogen fixation-related uncharacterized protein